MLYFEDVLIVVQQMCIVVCFGFEVGYLSLEVIKEEFGVEIEVFCDDWFEIEECIDVLFGYVDVVQYVVDVGYCEFFVYGGIESYFVCGVEDYVCVDQKFFEFR